MERWLSIPRFAVYLREAGADRERALALYEWNAELSAALLHDLGHLEVAVRNVYDEAITSTRPAGTRHWLDDPNGPVRAPLLRSRSRPDGTKYQVDVNGKLRDLLEQARKRCGRNAPVGKVIADLPLGFWRYLTSSAHEKTLWVPHLHTAFPHGTRRRDVDRTLSELHQLRNRVAHHEPLLCEPVAARSLDLILLCELLVPEVAQHVQVTTRVTDLLAARP